MVMVMYKKWEKNKDPELARKLYFSGVHHDMKYLDLNSKK